MKSGRGPFHERGDEENTGIIMAGSAPPWLFPMTSAEDQDDSVGEVIRYTLDELRFA